MTPPGALPTPYYERGGATLYVGDARDIVPLLAFDVIATDPPYGVGKKYQDCDDSLPTFRDLTAWLIGLDKPTAFTMTHQRLFDLPERPQWMGCWYKPFTGGLIHIGASPSWEPVCFYHLPAGDRGRARWDDVFKVNPHGFPFNGPREFVEHPCPKPAELFRALLNVMPEGVVLDPFCGTGATLRAAKDLGRTVIGIELSEKYAEYTVQRLAQEVLL